MRTFKTWMAAGLMGCAATLGVRAQDVQGFVHEQSDASGYVWPEDRQVREKLAEWQDQKFGVLFHWGLYSVPGIVESWSICSEDEEWIPRDTTMSYDEYMAAEVDDAVTIQAYVQAKQSYYAEQGTATVYLQDQDGGYFAYDMACTQEDYDAMTEGTKIQVSGFKAEWSGEIEIMDGQLDEIIADDTFVAEAFDATSLLGTEELEEHQNEKVSFTGLTVAPSKDADGNEAAFLYNYDGSGTQGDDVYFNVTVGDSEEVYSFLVESYLCGSDTEVYKAVEALEVGQTIDCEGFLYWYEGANPHITSVTVAA